MSYADILAKTGQRRESFALMIGHLESLESPVIIETGCVRQLDDYGAGYSTVLFDRYLQARGAGSLTSIDNDPGNLELARQLVRFRGSALLLSDSIRALSCSHVLDTPDLLYLDSYDYDYRDPHPCALHALMELAAAARLLVPGRSMVAVDDNFPDGSGKGKYVRQFMSATGRKLLHDGYQLVWKW